MVDFIRILKKAIDAQGNVTEQTRKRIYKRAIETLEQQFVVAKIPQDMAYEQRQILQSAITTVEEEYLAVEKKSFFSGAEWKSVGATENDKIIQNSVLPQGKDVSVVVPDKREEFFVPSSKESKTCDEASASNIPDAEPINMNVHFPSKSVNKKTLKESSLVSASQVDHSHVVSHIFSQALRRANRSSIQKRVMIGIVAFTSFIILIIGIFLIGKRVFVSNEYQLSKANIQVANALPRTFLTNKKLTQRLLEDGSEVDVGLDRTANGSSNGEGISTVVAANLQSIEQLGEAILYKTRTNYDTEKIATGSVRWSLIKESHVKGAPEESAIQGDITIPDEGLSLRLVLRRNTDISFPAAYTMDLIFITSDKFSGQAISNVQALTFKASEQSIGRSLTRTVFAKIDDDLFLIALSGNHPFLDRNLQLMRELDWIRLVLTDKRGRVNELTFAKGSTGEAIFNEVIKQWLIKPDKLTALEQKK
ncbi:hypothetical protein [Bartonella sp. CB175]|uniref:hypothetical protein n=1 Tax=Bartonella sp. CB175 TaxID=3112256 RepID=UPI00300DF511